jgi:hypothetical protein
MTAFVCLMPADEAWCRDDPDHLQIFFIGDTRGLLEPCG